MGTTDVQRASLTIPAAYLEDARGAIIAEIHDDAEALSYATETEDRDSAAEIMGRDVRLLGRLLSATGDTTVEAEFPDGMSSPITEMLEALVRQLTGRLERLCAYGPLPLGEMLDITDELRWAATEAIRVHPALDERNAVS